MQTSGTWGYSLDLRRPMTNDLPSFFASSGITVSYLLNSGPRKRRMSKGRRTRCGWRRMQIQLSCWRCAESYKLLHSIVPVARRGELGPNRDLTSPCNARLAQGRHESAAASESVSRWLLPQKRGRRRTIKFQSNCPVSPFGIVPNSSSD